MKRKIVSIAVVLGLLVVLMVGLMVGPTQAAPTVTVQHFYITAGGTSGPIPDGPGLIQRLDGDGSNLTTLVNLGSESRPRGITIDPVNSHLYWNDWGTGLTQRSNLDGSNVVAIISHSRGGLNDIAVDTLGGKLYVSMSGAPWPFHGVKQYNLDGSGEVTIWDALNNTFADDGWFIDGVGLDTVNGHVYFADIGVITSTGGPHGVIRADLNGANPVSLVPHLDGRGRGMAIDPVGGKMYFAQHSPATTGSGQIWRANLDGTSLEIIVTGLARPRDVALDLVGNKVYWVDEFTGLLQGANLDGSALHTVADGLLAPDSLAIEVVSNQPPIADAGPDQTVEQTYYQGADVTLNGSGSTDDGKLEPLSYFWISAIGNATGVSPTVTFPLGTTTINLTVFDGEYYDSDIVVVSVIDTTPPEVACIETVNPHGKNVPGGKNEDGFYELIATDICDSDPDIFVEDTGSGVIFGPFASGTKIKYTEAPGGKPSIKEMGSNNGQAGAIDWHIKGKGDAVVFAVDASGNMAAMMCYVPPPPK